MGHLLAGNAVWICVNWFTLSWQCHPDAKALNVSFDIGPPKFAVERVEIGRAGTDTTVSGGQNSGWTHQSWCLYEGHPASWVNSNVTSAAGTAGNADYKSRESIACCHQTFIIISSLFHVVCNILPPGSCRFLPSFSAARALASYKSSGPRYILPQPHPATAAFYENVGHHWFTIERLSRDQTCWFQIAGNRIQNAKKPSPDQIHHLVWEVHANSKTWPARLAEVSFSAIFD